MLWSGLRATDRAMVAIQRQKQEMKMIPLILQGGNYLPVIPASGEVSLLLLDFFQFGMEVYAESHSLKTTGFPIRMCGI